MYYNSKRNAEGESLYKTTKISNELIGNQGYHYEYDEMGNIISIEEGARKAGTATSLEASTRRTVLTYKYDSMNQLSRENNLYLNKTIEYTYDKGGNIKSKSVYPYTLDVDLSDQTPETIVYTYDSVWKDQLKSYNGQGITYDEIGNPVKYLGKTIGWTGRSMTGVTENGITSNYRYDASGLRTGKIVGVHESSYYYVDGLLAYEKRGNDKEFFYSYDSEGQDIFMIPGEK